MPLNLSFPLIATDNARDTFTDGFSVSFDEHNRYHEIEYVLCIDKKSVKESKK